MKVLKAERGGTEMPQFSLWTLNSFIFLCYIIITQKQKKKQNRGKSSRTKNLLILEKLLSLSNQTYFLFFFFIKGKQFRLGNVILPTLEMNLMRCIWSHCVYFGWIIGLSMAPGESPLIFSFYLDIKKLAVPLGSSHTANFLAGPTSHSYFSSLAARILHSTGTVAKVSQGPAGCKQ